MQHAMQKLRRWAFWSLDAIKANRIGNHYKQVQQILENPLSDETTAIMDVNLGNILDYATRTTDYYIPYKGFEDIKDFPISNKAIIIEHFEKMRSSKLFYAKNSEVFTSGSTGVPFTVLQDKNKRDRHAADTIYYLLKAGAHIGDKLVYMRHWSSKHGKNKLQTYLQNVFPVEVLDTSPKDMELLFDNLKKDRSRKYIVGYPSFFEQMCRYLDRHQPATNTAGVQSIISMAESLNDYERRGLAKYFNSPVFERYSNSENGIIAQQTTDSPYLLKLNCASYYVEILESDSDRHVAPGAIGRVVVTDLFNYAMPMIRYDTGDLAQYDLNMDGIPVLSTIYGRKMDQIYDTSGNVVSSHIFWKVGEYSKIKQYQFIQHGKKEYTFKLNAKPKDTREGAIVGHFQKYLGEDAKISFAYVDEIPALASGKWKKVTNTHGRAWNEKTRDITV